MIAASNGIEALELFEQNTTIDLVVTDLVMPHMGGIAMIKRLREHRSTLPILVTSGNLDQPSSDTLTGNITYMQKPYDPQALVSLVQRSLGKKG